MRRLGAMAAVAILAGLPVLAAYSPDQGSQAGPMPVERPIIAVTGALPSNEGLVDVAERATASVVNIASSRKVAVGEPFGGPSFGDPSWQRFFGEEFEQRMPQRE